MAESDDQDGEDTGEIRAHAVTLPVEVRELLDADRTSVIILDLDGTVRAANETALE